MAEGGGSKSQGDGDKTIGGSQVRIKKESGYIRSYSSPGQPYGVSQGHNKGYRLQRSHHLSLPGPEEEEEECSVDSLEMEDINQVEVFDDLSINRWLMRIMRLGGPFATSGSSGYNPAIKERRYSRGRRSSECFGGGLRTPPGRSRRMSDSTAFERSPRSRKGSVEQSNLVRMRNSNLGQSAPSLTASLVTIGWRKS